MVKEFRRPEIVKTRHLRVPNQYTLALDGEYRDFAFNEERAPLNRGLWRSEIFGVSESTPVDLEIGTGNGVHFRNYCQSYPSRCLVGLELKFKPLIQTIRGMRRMGASNGRICRIHAFNLDLLFGPQEINSVFMHFPDPWTSPRKPKNRMVNERMVDIFWSRQRPGSTFELKTDSREFFLGACKHMQLRPYESLVYSEDWHADARSEKHVRTQFERIFASQKLPIYYGLWRKPEHADPLVHQETLSRLRSEPRVGVDESSS